MLLNVWIVLSLGRLSGRRGHCDPNGDNGVEVNEGVCDTA